VAFLKAARDRAVEALDYAKKSGADPIEIDPVAIDRFSRLMREQLLSGDVAARKAYLSSVVDAIIVSEDSLRNSNVPTQVWAECDTAWKGLRVSSFRSPGGSHGSDKNSIGSANSLFFGPSSDAFKE
jgi:hypothetical protein